MSDWPKCDLCEKSSTHSVIDLIVLAPKPGEIYERSKPAGRAHNRCDDHPRESQTIYSTETE